MNAKTDLTEASVGTLINGMIMGLSGGLYKILISDGDARGFAYCRAKGAFRHNGLSPLVGDSVALRTTKNVRELIKSEKSDGGIVIEEIVDRRSALIRPPLANLDCMFVTMAASSPAPILTTVDKLIAIAEHNSIEPCIVVGKCELDEKRADEIVSIYEKSGFPAFKISCNENIGIDALRQYISENLRGKTAAFAGASGVGKSTLMNKLFPSLSLETGSISQKIERGKQQRNRLGQLEMTRQKNDRDNTQCQHHSLSDLQGQGRRKQIKERKKQIINRRDVYRKMRE